MSSYAVKGVRILLVGDDGVGKTSLILSLVTEEFPDEVPNRAEEITIPADVTPEKVPTHIVDFSFADQTEDELRLELEQADVICVVYGCDNDESISRITSYWLPIVFEVCGEPKKPVVLVGNKSDCMEAEGDKMNELLAIMDEYPEVETCIECSAYELKNISELFYYAQKAVLHPTAPLYSHDEQMLTEKCQEGLERIFKICDLDNDGVLNDIELNEFQKRCFRNSLPPHGLQEVKNTVKRHMKEGVTEEGVTIDGFLYLHTLFIQKGRQETTWTALRRFGYGTDLELKQDYLEPSIVIGDKCTTELSSSGLDFVMELFYKYDKDEDDALSPEELEDFQLLCPKEPFDDFSSTSLDENGWITAEGFVAYWILKTYVNHKWTLRMLANFGFIHGDIENQLTGLRITRAKDIDMQKRKSTRSVFLVYVVGKKNSGKTAFLQSFVDRYVGSYPKDKVLSEYAINAVTVKKQETYIILKEISEEESKESILEGKQDAVCFLYDTTDQKSFSHVASLYKEVMERAKCPSIFVGTKVDLSSVKQDYEIPQNEFAIQTTGVPLQFFSCSEQHAKYKNVFAKIATVAMNMGVSDSSERSIVKLTATVGLFVAVAAGLGFVAFKYLRKGGTAG